jgi:hypothetical protein
MILRSEVVACRAIGNKPSPPSHCNCQDTVSEPGRPSHRHQEVGHPTSGATVDVKPPQVALHLVTDRSSDRTLKETCCHSYSCTRAPAPQALKGMGQEKSVVLNSLLPIVTKVVRTVYHCCFVLQLRCFNAARCFVLQLRRLPVLFHPACYFLRAAALHCFVHLA